jgi:putative DNA primase/helicase
MENENAYFMKDIFLNSKDVYKETDNELLNYALHYARSGFPVIALHNLEKKYGILQCSCKSGVDCSNAGKHPRTRYGSNDATTDENKIFDWWDKKPNSNIGLLAGKESGFFVLDIDVKLDVPFNGEDTLEIMQEDYKILLGENYAPLPATLTAISGSGSRHLYFKYNLDLPIKNSASAIGLGLDIKSDGNYIVAPPSNHKSGNKYQWFGVNTPIEDAPDWLMYEIQIAMRPNQKKSSSKHSPVSQKSSKEIIPIGKRNNYIFGQISGLINSFPKEEVIRRAMEINDSLFDEPMKENEILRIIDWCWKKYGKSGSDDMGIKK